ncbi:MAG TPA: 1-(5-phosphoribosyl)-5-[(5-phosphoribosylamino)methylideneamino]imidazole-4-carboxamide isomerase [Candidatus Latescibacteria bacterium]|nr:1-(5-phosphoribosyl)-5-[(5-phosphoribosylamino)methylideneamino]imidazole-4-carboxamide isomerase [Candidatus Latescibacterota bacterium]
MLVLPAVDIKGGRCVRLLRGERGSEKVYSDDPVRAALVWQYEGARLIHVVDLDGAWEGMPRNWKVVSRILKAVEVPIQLGGGLRSLEAIGRVLDAGVERVVLGTAAVEEPQLVAEAVRRFGPERIIVGVDVKDGEVAVKGWTEGSGLPPSVLGLRMRDLGVVRALYTDISRDGALSGPNIEAIRKFTESTGLKLIASGGISSLGDVCKVKELEHLGVEGMVVGRALYEGRLSLREAIEVAGGTFWGFR